jgi:uncharacterized protein YajQ (UPF0234 family)
MQEIEVFECYVKTDIDGKGIASLVQVFYASNEILEDEKGKETGIHLPYVVTLIKGSNEVLAIRRNWKEDDDLKLKQMHELLQGHFARRKIDAGAIDYKTVETAAGQAVRQKAIIKQGIDREVAKRIVKEVKDGKFKVQVTVQGDELRVSGKKRDDLQAVIAHIKGLDIELPLQYVNFRE